ncbi:estradiol 17-beta-dehydrogenase 11-like [Uranotaenia lowii]|uniref:estradiol 17-beta-dehydrogenase 11-like n=1 Tax=Uranotaenia lowii TaxID=190385 RepID=UPI00247A1B7A|nr:estradiol 17-beta-dehydrogenase 11-like [Uranotaenia lowii]
MGSLVEFQKLPYHPADPLPQKTFLQKVLVGLKVVLKLLVYIAKVIPLSIYLWLKSFRCRRPKDIRDWVALVTGGANGLGRQIALELAKVGCHVVVADLDAEASMKTVLELRYYGVKAVAYQVDVACPDQIRDLQRKIEADIGPVDILVNNAGILPFMVSDDYTPENLQRYMNCNVLSNFYTVNAFLPGMYQRQRGHIVAISSLAAYFPGGLYRNYATTKYAIRGFMEELHDEIYLAGHNKFVKTTTAFPIIMNTRKELIDTIRKLPYISKTPIVEPQVAAESIVRNLRINRRKALAPDWVSIGWFAFLDDIHRKIKYLFLDTVLT